MSDEYTERYLEGRYEEYIDRGYTPKDAEIMAHEDLEHDSIRSCSRAGGRNQ